MLTHGYALEFPTKMQPRKFSVTQKRAYQINPSVSFIISPFFLTSNVGDLNPLPPSNAVRQQKKKYFCGSFQISIVLIKKIPPLWKP